MGAEPEVGAAYCQHDDKTRQHDSKRREQAAPNGTCGGKTDIGGAVDADRTRRDLADGDDIHKLLLRHPAVLFHLDLDKRQDRQASAEAEETYLEERYEELEIKQSYLRLDDLRFDDLFGHFAIYSYANYC